MNIKEAQARLRVFLNKHRLAAITIALAIVGLSLAGVALQLHHTSNSLAPKAFYFDLTSGAVFTAMPTEAPPIAVPGSPQSSAAEAFVFACNSCADERDRFVAYVSLYEPQAKKKLMELAAANAASGLDAALALQYAREQAAGDPTIEEGRVIGVAKVSEKGKAAFFRADSREAIEIINSPDTHCTKGRRAVACAPADIAQK